MFQRLLVPLDGSLRAEQALPVAAQIARASSGSIHLLQVVAFPVDYSGGMAPVPLASDELIKAEIAQSTDYLTAVAALPILAGITITTEALLGLPAQDILSVAESRAVDLIVLCSHGRTGFVRWALGSVAHTLAHTSTIPTLILRESEQPASLLGLTKQPLCVLVPLDGSALAETALPPAAYLVAALAAPAQGSLHLAQVVKLLSEAADEGFVSELNREAKDRASAYLTHVAEHLQETMKDLQISITWSVAHEKDVTSALLHLAERTRKRKDSGEMGQCDLIALSTHGRHGLARWVIGSVADRLLSATKLPVLIVRPPQPN